MVKNFYFLFNNTLPRVRVYKYRMGFPFYFAAGKFKEKAKTSVCVAYFRKII